MPTSRDDLPYLREGERKGMVSYIGLGRSVGHVVIRTPEPVTMLCYT